MDALRLILITLWPLVPADLHLIVSKSQYNTEWHGNVTMEWSVSPRRDLTSSRSVVLCSRTLPPPERNLCYRYEGIEHTFYTHADFDGRVQLDADALSQGWVRLQLSDLRLGDAGSYECTVAVNSRKEAKLCSLNVIVPYEQPNVTIHTSSADGLTELRCETEGFPQANITWTSHAGRRDLAADVRFTSEPTPEGLFHLTSILPIVSTSTNRYVCTVTEVGGASQAVAFDVRPVRYYRFLCVPAAMLLTVGLLLGLIAQAKGREEYSLKRSVILQNESKTAIDV